MSGFQWVFYAFSGVIGLSVLVFFRALIFQGRSSGPNQYMVKLLEPPTRLKRGKKANAAHKLEVIKKNLKNTP